MKSCLFVQGKSKSTGAKHKEYKKEILKSLKAYMMKRCKAMQMFKYQCSNQNGFNKKSVHIQYKKGPIFPCHCLTLICKSEMSKSHKKYDRLKEIVSDIIHCHCRYLL